MKANRVEREREKKSKTEEEDGWLEEQIVELSVVCVLTQTVTAHFLIGRKSWEPYI